MRLQPIDRGIRILAPAKLNLYLEVRGDRPDGYHEIESILHSIVGDSPGGGKLMDVIDVRLGPPGIAFRCDDPALPTGSENLAVRAAQAALARSRGTSGLEIALRKGIPAGAGLGGGSSDAAAVLVAASRLLGLDSSPAALLESAAAIGSDVPFFLHGGTALVRGRGEKVEPLAASGTLHFVVAVPAQSVSTKEIYDALPELTHPAGGPRMHALLLALERRNVEEVREAIFNRLEPLVRERHPRVESLHSRFQSLASSPVRITGSGSGLYCVCRGRKEASDLQLRISALEEGETWIASSEPRTLAPGAGASGGGDDTWRLPKSGSS